MTTLRVLKHQGTSRTTGEWHPNPSGSLSVFSLDASVLKRYDVVVTTYDTVQSEHAVYTPPIKDASATSKTKKPTSIDSDSESDLEDAMAQLKAKRSSKAASKKKCALFDVKWYRVVLGRSTGLHGMNGRS